MIVQGAHGEYKIGGIYRHYKGNYYMIDEVAFLHGSQNIYLIIYHQCTKEGTFVSIREGDKIIYQPFATHETRWHDVVDFKTKLKRFTLTN
jgi:hypothetical protein